MPVDIATAELRPPTDTERRVIRLVAEGKTNRQIGSALHMSEETVKTHLHRLFVDWSVATRIELIHVATRNGWAACLNCGPAMGGAARLMAAARALKGHAEHLEALAAQIAAGGHHG